MSLGERGHVAARAVEGHRPLDRTPLRALRNREGHWAWALHRLTGLGVLAFLCMHVVDTSLMLAGEEAYNHLIRSVYQQWWFQPAEVALGGALVYHTLNGLRIIALDFWEGGIRHDPLLRRLVAGGVVAVMVPLTAVMLLPFVSL
ncbi:MAG TPA: succinate dehydrogenase, cytochrome b556 subunit [Chloroflexota bacterium]|nr:succinate dehydrogenase, cytochrome b556 subunit [Chloroflexota bacterium]